MLAALSTSASQSCEVLEISQRKIGFFKWLEALDEYEDLSHVNYHVLVTLARQADTPTGSKIFLNIQRLAEKTRTTLKVVYRALEWAENNLLILVNRKRSVRKWDHTVIQLTDKSNCPPDNPPKDDHDQLRNEVSTRQSNCPPDNPDLEFPQVTPPKSESYLSPYLSLLKDKGQDQQSETPKPKKKISENWDSLSPAQKVIMIGKQSLQPNKIEDFESRPPTPSVHSRVYAGSKGCADDLENKVNEKDEITRMIRERIKLGNLSTVSP